MKRNIITFAIFFVFLVVVCLISEDTVTIDQLTETTDPYSTDLYLITKDSSANWVSRKMSHGSLINALAGGGLGTTGGTGLYVKMKSNGGLAWDMSYNIYVDVAGVSGLITDGTGLRINTSTAKGTKIDGGNLAVAYGAGLTTDASGIRVQIDGDSAIGFTPGYKLYAKVDKTRALDYYSGKIGINLSALAPGLAGSGLGSTGSTMKILTKEEYGTKVVNDTLSVAYSAGLTTDAGGIRVNTAPDSAMGLTAGYKLYPRIDKDRGLDYYSGKIGVHLNTQNLFFNTSKEIEVNPTMEVYNDTLYIRWSGGDWKQVTLQPSSGPP